MGEHIDRASLMGKLISSTTQMAIREMDGNEVYGFVLGLINDEPAADDTLRPCSICGSKGMHLGDGWVCCSNEECPASIAGYPLSLRQESEWGKRYKWDKDKRWAVYVGGDDNG